MHKQRIDPRLEQAFSFLLVAAVGIIIGYFIHKAIATPKYDYSPQTLEDKIKETDEY